VVWICVLTSRATTLQVQNYRRSGCLGYHGEIPGQVDKVRAPRQEISKVQFHQGEGFAGKDFHCAHV
jgi:hypothetical protein